MAGGHPRGLGICHIPHSDGIARFPPDDVTLVLTLPSCGPRLGAAVLGDCAPSTLLVSQGSPGTWPGLFKAICTPSPRDFAKTAPLRGGESQEPGVRGLGVCPF